MFCFFFIYCFLNFKTKVITYLKPLNLFNKCFSFSFSRKFSIFDLQFSIKRIRGFDTTRVCISFKSMGLIYCFFIAFVSSRKKKTKRGFVVFYLLSVLEFLPVSACKTLAFFKACVRYFLSNIYFFTK